MYDIRCTWYVHAHSSILNLYLCTHYMQQHCCNVVVAHIIPGNIYAEYIYGYAHVSHVSDVLSFYLLHINPGLALVEEKHA